MEKERTPIVLALAETRKESRRLLGAPEEKVLALAFEKLRKFLKFLKEGDVSSEEIVCIFDIDYVLRRPYPLKPGAIKEEVTKFLSAIKEEGFSIGGFVTNQPLEGHQVARVLGPRLGYRPMKDALQETLGETSFFSAGKDWLFLFRRTKGPEGAKRVANFLLERYPKASVFVYFGDRYDVDLPFWELVREEFGDTTERIFIFVKMPNPLDGLKTPSLLMKLIP